MNQQEMQAQYEAELRAMQAQQQAYASQSQPYSSSMFASGQKQNLVEWELDFKPELEDIERLLRCDILIRDKEGNEVWITNPDQSKVFLNDLGVQDILRKIRLIVNKNKVLSYYQIDEIKVRVKMIMNELRVLIYNNYEQYGIDNEYKMNNYSMIVIAIGTLVEDAYRRAMNGETHKGLNEQRLVTQTDPLNQQMGSYNAPQQQKTKSWLNPFSWGH